MNYSKKPCAPCKDCVERTIEPRCHITCKRYLSFLEETEEFRKKQAIIGPTTGYIKHEKRRKSNVAWRVLTKKEI